MQEEQQQNHSRSDTFRVAWGPQRFYLSIGWKTLIAFALVVFIPMLGVLAITTSTLRTALEGEALHSLEANLRGAWRVYHERSGNVREALLQSAATPSVVEAMASADSAALAALFNRHAAQLPYTDIWLAVDTQRRVIGRRNGPLGEPVHLNNVITRALSDGRPVTSTELLPGPLFLQENPLSYANLDTQVLTQVVAVPVSSHDQRLGTLVGIILLNNDNWLPNAIHDYLSIDAALFGSIIQESRIIAASSRPNNIWATGLLAPTALRDTIQSGQTWQGGLEINDIPVFIVSEPIRNLEDTPIGALAIGVKRSSIDALIMRNTRSIYLFIAFGFLLSLVIALLAYRDTMAPMRAIIGAMDAFARGRLHARTDIRTKDEFENMGECFNRMAQSIEEHQHRVESFNALTSLLITRAEPEALLEEVLGKVIELTAADGGVIYLVDRNEEHPRLHPTIGHAVNIDAMEILEMGVGMAGEAAAKQRVHYIDDIPGDCRVMIDFGLLKALPREVIAFPIVYQEEVLGVMLLATVHHFDQNQRGVLEYVANQIAIVLENAYTHEQVRRLSITDGLTGLYNRRYITERLEAEFSKSQRYGTPLSLIMLDIDNFKQINDTLGHQAGDEALRAVARVLKEALRESDIAGRYGGEEFLIALPHTDQSAARQVAEKIRRTIEAGHYPSLGDHYLTASLGVAAGGTTLEALIQEADAAMYQAKHEGRNRVIAA